MVILISIAILVVMTYMLSKGSTEEQQEENTTQQLENSPKNKPIYTPKSAEDLERERQKKIEEAHRIRMDMATEDMYHDMFYDQYGDSDDFYQTDLPTFSDRYATDYEYYEKVNRLIDEGFL